MPAGRTCPLVLACVPQDRSQSLIIRPGHSGSAAPPQPEDLVVKALGLPEITDQRLFCEYVGNLVGRMMGLYTAEPFFVDIGHEAADMINSNLRRQDKNFMVKSGLAVGCRLLTPTRPVVPGAALTADELLHAARLYVYDALVQNPDRVVHNPNCAWHRGDLFAYDFESAFSFLLALTLPSEARTQPWIVSHLPFLRRHVFHTMLSRQMREWDRVVSAVDGVTSESLERMAEQLPQEWKSLTDRVFYHLGEVVSNRDRFHQEIRKSLL